MRVLLALAIFAAILNGILCVYFYVIIGEPRLLLPIWPHPWIALFERTGLSWNYGEPLTISLLAAVFSLAFGLWRVAESRFALAGLLAGLAIICASAPITALISFAVGSCGLTGHSLTVCLP